MVDTEENLEAAFEDQEMETEMGFDQRMNNASMKAKAAYRKDGQARMQDVGKSLFRAEQNFESSNEAMEYANADSTSAMADIGGEELALEGQLLSTERSFV